MSADRRLRDLAAKAIAHVLSHFSEGQLRFIALKKVEKGATHEQLQRAMAIK